MKISYANMKLKLNTEVNTFNFKDQKVQVLKYLPAQDKYDLFEVTLQKAQEDYGYNEFKITMYFELYLVYMYTNISFTEKQREDELKIYDNLKSNGFFDLFFSHLEEEEYQELFSLLNLMKANYTRYKISINSILNNLINNLPQNAEMAAKIVDSFNPEQYKAVVDFAKYANGGRDIFTNQKEET